jgi:hypothetical protein
MDLKKAARDIAAKSGKFKKELLGQIPARIMETAGN